MYFNVAFDSSVSTAPTAFKACVNAVCQYYDALFTNNVAVSVSVGWGEVGGQKIDAGALGESSSFYFTQDYSQVAAALKAQNAPGASTLPAISPASGNLQVTTAESRALGVANSSGSDGAIGIDSTQQWFYDPTQSQAVPSNAYDFFGTVAHELSEVMGRGSNLNVADTYTVLDLYRYASNGVRQLTAGVPAACGASGDTGFSVATGPLTLNTGTAAYCIDETGVIRVNSAAAGGGAGPAAPCSTSGFPPLQ